MRKLIVMGIPHHANVGDNAIAVAEEQILDKYFPNYEKYYMQENYLDICAKRIEKFINDEDVILLHGGGNIGDTYVTPEKGRREVIKLFPNNKIIIFPQTAYFSETENGRKELEVSKKIYNNHNNLIIMAREKKSYNFMKEHFYNAKIYLTPDIVMSMSKHSNKERKGVLLLFRADKEKVLQEKDREMIKKLSDIKFGEYHLSDMDLTNEVINIAGHIRDKILEDKFNEFQTAQIVITDRLHGMIFAAITETPCIVFSNFNHKITESYRWLENLGYIKYCNRIEDIEENINEVISAKNIKYDNSFAENCIVKILKEEIEGDK